MMVYMYVGVYVSGYVVHYRYTHCTEAVHCQGVLFGVFHPCL